MAKIDIKMDKNKEVTACFWKKKYTLKTLVDPVDGGTITGAGKYPINTIVTVEAIANPDFEFIHWLGIGKWSGLGMYCLHYDIGYIDTMFSNGFIELRMDGPSYQSAWVNDSKAGILLFIAKGAKVIWGVTSDEVELTATTWVDFRLAILDAAQWAQANGVFEFQIGNEEEYHIDGTTMTLTQLIANLKSVATEVKAIFTRGNVSYSCGQMDIGSWVSAGKGDIDILASNIYQQTPSGLKPWKDYIDSLYTAFGSTGTAITEFGPDASGLEHYSTDEAVQAVAVTEMLDYIKASGITRAIYFKWIDYKGGLFGVMKEDGTYRLLWDALLNSK